MGQETVDKILEKNKLETKYEETQTLKFNLIGSYSRLSAVTEVDLNSKQVFEQYEDHLTFAKDLSRDVAKHLVHTYGTSSKRVFELGEKNRLLGLPGLNEKIHPEYPFLKSEISYAVKYELAEKPNDIICRRVPIAFLNSQAALDILPEVVQILAKEKKWSKQKQDEEMEEAKKLLQYQK